MSKVTLMMRYLFLYCHLVMLENKLAVYSFKNMLEKDGGILVMIMIIDAVTFDGSSLKSLIDNQ